jgi:hypothetical protein
MTSGVPEAPDLRPRERAVEAATSGRPELAQAWALIAIGDELKAIRQEQHRQARQRVSRG